MVFLLLGGRLWVVQFSLYFRLILKSMFSVRFFLKGEGRLFFSKLPAKKSKRLVMDFVNLHDQLLM